MPAAGREGSTDETRTAGDAIFGAWYMRSEALYAEVEIGMPLTGRANLAETPLLKLLGDIRWRHVAELSGVNSRDLADEDGDRLYATFFYVELVFPPETPMSSFGENDRLTIVSTIHADDDLLLDGFHVLYPADWPEQRQQPVHTMEEALSLGIPVARTSNAFVKMLGGAHWLKKGVPVNPGMDRVPHHPGAQDLYRQVLVVSGGNRAFSGPPPGFVPLTEGKVEVEYVPDSDRDLNGVGLLYFANYPAVLDFAERHALARGSMVPISDELLDRRTLLQRRSAYISNIVPPDTTKVFVEAWIDNPLLRGEPEPERQQPRLFMNFHMFRESDGRKMMVSSAEKVLSGITLGESGLLDALAGMGAQAGGLQA